MIYVGGDQSPLRQGFLRAAVMQSYLKERNADLKYFIHDTDLVGRMPGHLVDDDGLAVVTAKQNVGVWLTVEWNRPFLPLPVDSRTLREISGIGSSKSKKLARWFRDEHDFYRRGLVIGDERADSVIMADLRYDNWPTLQEVVLAEYNQEIAWALNMHPGVDAKKRAQKLRLFIQENTGDSIIATQMNIARMILQDRIDAVDIGTSTDLWKIDSDTAECDPRFSLLQGFLSDADMREKYNEVVAQTRRRAHEDDLPFWLVQRNAKGQLERQSLPCGEASSLADIKRLYGCVSVVPKALLVYVQMNEYGSLYKTHLNYQHQAQELAQTLGVEQNSSVSIEFNFKKVMQDIGLWEKTNNLPWLSHAAAHLPDQQKVVDWQRKRSLEYWVGRPTLIYTYIVGGLAAIDQLIETANVTADV